MEIHHITGDLLREIMPPPQPRIKNNESRNQNLKSIIANLQNLGLTN